MKKNTIAKDTVRITLITLVAGFALGLVNEITKEPIAQQEAKAKAEACKAVFADADDFAAIEDLSGAADALESAGLTGKADVNEAYEAKKGGETVGYVITVTDHEGYGGDIQFSVGVSTDDTLTGISILSIGETAGLGMKAKNADFQAQFVGLPATGNLEYTKTGEEGKIDALSGATITTNAMTNGTNAAIAFYNSMK
ncbi:RnfABCDGE type electron transport complex subunit G [Oscillospiraceae bacterium Marseille-Q3528]|nr:RnfABCDGE type electron transport complex subunit G [Oscillospiraceae bacterium Marseille-Q3528]